jgi:hypothetical protein
MEGGSYLPVNFKRDMAFFKAYSKSLTRILPSTGNSPVSAGNVTIFQMPQASVLNMRSFRLNFHGETSGDATNAVKFSKYMASLISRIEIFINGVSIQNIDHYHDIYHIVRDYSRDYDKYASKLCNNADPATVKKSLAADGTIADRTGEYLNKDIGDYCIDDWCGFLETCPEFVNTNLFGNMEVHITWADNAVLFKDAGATNPSYTLSNLVAWVDVVHFKDDSYLRELDRILQTEGELVIPYKNYRSYLGSTTTDNKTTTTRISESTQSLDKIMLTFLPNDRTTPDALNAEINNSKYFQRSGLGLGEEGGKYSPAIQFEINSQDVSNPLSLVEAYQETLKAFELDRDNMKKANPLINSLVNYEKNFFVAALSTSHLNSPKETKNIVSGMDTMATNLNLAIKTTQSKATDAAQGAQPLIITEMTALLRIAPGRQISTMF